MEDDESGTEDTSSSSDEEPEERYASVASESSCECQCCTQPNIAHQPLEVSDSKIMHIHHSKERKVGQRKSYVRMIQPSWYSKYPWITVCTHMFRILCYLS